MEGRVLLSFFVVYKPTVMDLTVGLFQYHVQLI